MLYRKMTCTAVRSNTMITKWSYCSRCGILHNNDCLHKTTWHGECLCSHQMTNWLPTLWSTSQSDDVYWSMQYMTKWLPFLYGLRHWVMTSADLTHCARDTTQSLQCAMQQCTMITYNDYPLFLQNDHLHCSVWYYTTTITNCMPGTEWCPVLLCCTSHNGYLLYDWHRMMSCAVLWCTSHNGYLLYDWHRMMSCGALLHITQWLPTVCLAQNDVLCCTSHNGYLLYDWHRMMSCGAHHTMVTYCMTGTEWGPVVHITQWLPTVWLAQNEVLWCTSHNGYLLYDWHRMRSCGAHHTMVTYCMTGTECPVVHITQWLPTVWLAQNEVLWCTSHNGYLLYDWHRMRSCGAHHTMVTYCMTGTEWGPVVHITQWLPTVWLAQNEVLWCTSHNGYLLYDWHRMRSCGAVWCT